MTSKGRLWAGLGTLLVLAVAVAVAVAVAPLDGAMVKHHWKLVTGQAKPNEIALPADEDAYVRAVAVALALRGADAVALRERLTGTLTVPEVRVDDADATELADFLERHDPKGVVAASGAAPVLLKATAYGAETKGLLLETSPRSRTLLIHHQGHGGNPLLQPEAPEIVEAARSAGADVLFLSMAALGFNAYDRLAVPTRMGPVEIPPERPHRHGGFAFFHDSERPERTGIAMMIGGNHAIIRHAIELRDYSEVMMSGISGGGWSTTVHAALLPEIETSVSFAGTVPMAMRTIAKNFGDYEQVFDPVFRTIDYWDLYALATLDASGEATRTHLQVYFSNDPCCFDGKTGALVAGVYARTPGIEGLSFSIVNSYAHAPDVDIIRQLLAPTWRDDRRPGYAGRWRTPKRKAEAERTGLAAASIGPAGRLRLLHRAARETPK